MKQSIILFASLLSISAFADGSKAPAPAPAPNLTAICNLSDFTNLDEPNIKNEELTFKSSDVVKWTNYNGHKYEIGYFDVSNEEKARYELNIAALDEKTGAVISSASGTFTADSPDLVFQDGANILLRCSGK
jgi:hypothetical protein